MLLGLGLGEAEEPLDAGKVGLHYLGTQAAQRGPHGAVLCGGGAPVRLTHAPGRQGQAGPAKEALRLLSHRVHAYVSRLAGDPAFSQASASTFSD